jgi:hypothetical protein
MCQSPIPSLFNRGAIAVGCVVRPSPYSEFDKSRLALLAADFRAKPPKHCRKALCFSVEIKGDADPHRARMVASTGPGRMGWW